jgi:hypothetical protein
MITVTGAPSYLPQAGQVSRRYSISRGRWRIPGQSIAIGFSSALGGVRQAKASPDGTETPRSGSTVRHAVAMSPHDRFGLDTPGATYDPSATPILRSGDARPTRHGPDRPLRPGSRPGRCAPT